MPTNPLDIAPGAWFPGGLPSFTTTEGMAASELRGLRLLAGLFALLARDLRGAAEADYLDQAARILSENVRELEELRQLDSLLSQVQVNEHLHAEELPLAQAAGSAGTRYVPQAAYGPREFSALAVPQPYSPFDAQQAARQAFGQPINQVDTPSRDFLRTEVLAFNTSSETNGTNLTEAANQMKESSRNFFENIFTWGGLLGTIAAIVLWSIIAIVLCFCCCFCCWGRGQH